MKEDFHVKDSNLPDLLFPKAFPQCCSREEQLRKFLEYCKENIYQGEHFCSLLLCKSCTLSRLFSQKSNKNSSQNIYGWLLRKKGGKT